MERKDLLLAKTKRYLKMLLFGHTSIKSQKLENVTYPKHTAIMCSTYVAITFLKAVNKMNSHLETKGFSERIAHPFGEHENLMNMDILRLIHLWNRVKLIKTSSINETVAKVFLSKSSMTLAP